MIAECEIDGCGGDAQGKLTTSGYELCTGHYARWSEQNLFVVEDRGKVLLKGSEPSGP